jgi:hypothetical protein
MLGFVCVFRSLIFKLWLNLKFGLKIENKIKHRKGKEKPSPARPPHHSGPLLLSDHVAHSIHSLSSQPAYMCLHAGPTRQPLQPCTRLDSSRFVLTGCWYLFSNAIH